MQNGTGDRYLINNILNTNKRPFHCSAKGLKFVASLKHKDGAEFVLSNLSFRAAPNCTSQLKTGICFVTDDKLDESDLALFDSVPAAEVAATLAGLADKFKQAHVFTIQDEEGELELDIFNLHNTWWRGKYLTLKFIDAHGDNENIDLGTLGVIGT